MSELQVAPCVGILTDIPISLAVVRNFEIPTSALTGLRSSFELHDQKLPSQDLNLELIFQRDACCHYTTGEGGSLE